MKKYSFFFIFFLLITAKLFSQDKDCNCIENLKKLVEKTEENYAGFPAKVNALSKGPYKQLVAYLTNKSLQANSPEPCFYILKEYIQFFKDKHFMLGFEGNKKPESATVTLLEKAFRNYLSTTKISPIEGIWVNADSTIKMAIRKKTSKEFQGIILESKELNLPVGLIYFTFLKTPKGWVAREFNNYLTSDIVTKQKGNLLQIWNQKMFGKIYPTAMLLKEKEELNTWKNNNNGLDFKVLSAKTAYLKIPTFKNNDHKIMELVGQYDATIRKTDYLIVDLTGNGGGNTGWVSFLPYFMTNEIYQFDTYLRVTPENVKFKLADLEPFAVNPIPDEYKKYFPSEVLAAYKKAYKELPTTNKLFYPIPGVTFPLDSVMAKPKKIALIVDDFSGSSTEYFFSLTKQSKKTTTYGINTIGMMDYEGMSNPTSLPYNKYILTIPIVKSSWTDKNPIDETGFKPTILLNKIDQTKWIEFVMHDLEKNEKRK